jgi:hypothetical protein
MSSNQLDRIPETMAPGAVVRVVTPSGATEARGGAGARLLTDTLREEGLWGRQIRGDVHAGKPSITMVLRHGDGNSVTDRVLIFRVAGWSITQVDYYRLGPPAPPVQPA